MEVNSGEWGWQDWGGGEMSRKVAGRGEHAFEDNNNNLLRTLI